MSQKRGGQGRATGYQRSNNTSNAQQSFQYEESARNAQNYQGEAKRGGGGASHQGGNSGRGGSGAGALNGNSQNASNGGGANQAHRVVLDTTLSQKQQTKEQINYDNDQHPPHSRDDQRAGNRKQRGGGNQNNGQHEQPTRGGTTQSSSRGGGRGQQSYQRGGGGQSQNQYYEYEEQQNTNLHQTSSQSSQGRGRGGRGRGTSLHQQQYAEEFYPSSKGRGNSNQTGRGKPLDNNQQYQQTNFTGLNYQGQQQQNQFYSNQQQMPSFPPFIMPAQPNQWVGDYQRDFDYNQQQVAASNIYQEEEKKGSSNLSQNLSGSFRPGPPGVIHYAKQPKTHDHRREQTIPQKSQITAMQDQYLQQYDHKLSFDDVHEEKVIQDKRSMNVCISYKEFMRPDFFQGPTYIIFKEPSKIKNHKYPDNKDAEDDQSYEVVQFPPIRPKPVIGQRPPRKFSDSNQGSAKKKARKEKETAAAEVFDVKTEKRKGNKFWNELEGVATKQPAAGKTANNKSSNAPTTKRQPSGLLKKQKKAISSQASFNGPRGGQDKHKKGGKKLADKTHHKKINFEEYLQVEEELKKGIADGKFFEGILRVNPNNRNRAFVTINGIAIDVMIDGLSSQNRALDGDTVVIQLLDPNRWPSLTASNITIAGKKFEPKTQGFTNETAIETRVIDVESDLAKAVSHQASAAKVPLPKEETKQKVPAPVKKVTLKHQANILGESDHEGEEQGESVASSSSSSEDSEVDKFMEQEEEKLIQGTRHKQPQSLYSEGEEVPEQYDLDEEEEISDHDGEVKRNPFSQPKELKSLSQQVTNHAAHPRQRALRSTYFGAGKSRSEILAMVNELAQECRPCGQVRAILKSPNREREQMITLSVQDKDRMDDDSFIKLISGDIPASAKDKATGQISAKVAMNCGIYAVPVSKKLPWMSLINIPQELIDDIRNNKKPQNRYYIAKFESWNVGFIRPTCRILSQIGEAGNLDAESLRILKTHDVWCDEYETEGQKLNEKVHESLRVFTQHIDDKTGEWKIPQEEINLRMDLRHKRIFTIDPITAKDLDDALSIDKITDTIYEIGVHIADVSYFVQQGTELDREAQLRCTSVYFVHRVYPMLPRLLCERLCSLNPQVDRLSYSIFFRLDINTGEIDRSFKPKLARTVMRSCAKWNYQLVQDILDKKITSEDQLPEQYKPKEQNFEDMVADCFLMHEIAQKRRAKRLENGSIMLSNREFMFDLDPQSKLPLSFNESKTRMPSKHLVEEYMLLANILVAEHLFTFCNDKTLLRVHPDLDKEKKELLEIYFEKVGLKGVINLANSKTLSTSLEALKATGDSLKFNVAMRKFLTCLQCAKYMCINESTPEQYQHFGLNFPLYTHFTSPIRRYADLLVHRLVTLTLTHGEKTRDLIELMDYSEYAEICSEKSLNAKRASTQCTRLFHCLLLKQQGVRVFETLLFDLDISGNIVIYIDEVNLHHKIRLRDDPRIDSVTFFEEEMVMVAHIKPVCTDNSKQNRLKSNSAGEQQADEFRKVTKLAQFTDKNSIFAPEELLIFRIFDKVKVRVDTTTEFPLDIQCTIVFGKEDLEDYARLAQEQEAHMAEGSGLIIGGAQQAVPLGKAGVVEINNLDADV